MLNMDSFFQKFTLPIIKTEDLSETIDINPKNTVKQWDLEVTEKFVKHTFFTSEKELDTIMKTYVSSLKNRAIHFKDKPLLKEKILNHVKILHLCLKGTEQNYIVDASYYQYMEEILTIYCNLELGLARHLRRNEMPTKDYNHQINAISRRICKLLSIFLERKKHIIHVLLKLTFRSNIHAHQYIMRLVFMHFLMKSPLENLSDEAFCRYYLAFERYKEVSTEDCRAKMDDALFLRFQKKPDFLKTSEIMKKVLRPANYSITGIINHLMDYKSVTVQAYFDYMKNKNCEELPDVINILNFHDNEEHSKDENNFGRVYSDVIKSFTHKPTHLEIKEEECIELDSDSDVAVTSDGLIQLILGDSDDEICEIAFMENSINNKHKSRKKKKLHDAYPIVSYIDLDNDIPTTSSSCQEQMATPTTTSASISTSVQPFSLSSQSVMTVSRSQQTSPLKESDSSVCESMLCENSIACSSKYPSTECKSQVEQQPKRTTIFRAVEIQTDPVMPRSCRAKENNWSTEMNNKVFSSQISERGRERERTTGTSKKSVGVDPMHQQHEENESSKENHHLNKSIRSDGQLSCSKRIHSITFNNNNKRNVDVMDSEVECIDLIMDERNEISNILVKSDITKKKQLTFEASTDVDECLKQNKETVAEKKTPLLPDSQLSNLPKISVSTQLLSLNSQPVKTISRSQQTTEDIENNSNSMCEENFIDITNEPSPEDHSNYKEEKRVSFKVVETQTVETATVLNQLEDIRRNEMFKTHSSNSVSNAKEYYNTDSTNQQKEVENRLCKPSLTQRLDDQLNEARRRRSITFNDYKLVDSEVQCVVDTAKERNEESVMEKTENITDLSPKDIHNTTETATNTKEVQNASEKDSSANATYIGIIIDDSVSSPEVELIETDTIQNVNEPTENRNAYALPNQDVTLVVESESNTLQNNQEENSNMEVDISCSKQNSTEGNLLDDDTDTANSSAVNDCTSGSSNNLLHHEKDASEPLPTVHEKDTSEPLPTVHENHTSEPLTTVQDIPNGANDGASDNKGSEELPAVNDEEDINSVEPAQDILVDDLSSPDKDSPENLLGAANSDEVRSSDLKVSRDSSSDACNSLNSAEQNHDGQEEHVSDLTVRNEESSASDKDKVYLVEPQSSLDILPHETSFEAEDTVIQPLVCEEQQLHLSTDSSAEQIPESDATTKDIDSENCVTNSVVSDEQFSNNKIGPTEIVNESTENKDENVTCEEEIEKRRKLDELKDVAQDSDTVEKNLNKIHEDVAQDNDTVEMNMNKIHEETHDDTTRESEMTEKSDQDLNTSESGGFENVDKLIKSKDTNGLRFNSEGIDNKSSRHSQKERSTRQKRNKAKRSLKFDNTQGDVESNISSVPVKIQRVGNFVEPSVAVDETVAPASSVEFLEQSFTAEEPTVVSEEIVTPAISEVTWPVVGHNISNININTPNVVIYNFIIQNPVAEAVTSQNITDVTEVVNNNEINFENPEQCSNTEENSATIEQNTGEIVATDNTTYTEQFTSEINDLPEGEAEVHIETLPTGEDMVGGEISDEHDATGEETVQDSPTAEKDVVIDKSKHNGNALGNNKTSKTVYTCESVKEIPLEEFSKMEKKFSHLLNSSERDEFEDVFSGPVTRLNKNSSNSLYYENSNGFKFDLFSFAKSQPMFCSNLDEKDFVLENKGNSPASSRSGSPTVSPEYEVFDWSDFGNYMEQSHMQRERGTLKHKAKQQSDKPRPVKRCKFSETVKTRFIDSDSEYSDHLVPMDNLKEVQYEHRCEDVMWNGIKCFMDPNDMKLLSETSVALSRISDKELAYRIYRPNMEKFVYQQSEPYKKPRHNTSRSCIQQKLDFNKDSNSHRTEAYARLGVGNFVSSNYPTEDYTPLGVGGFNSSNYVPTTRISDKGMVDITNLVPINNECEFHSENVSAQLDNAKIVYSDSLNLSIPYKQKAPELHSEFSNSPKFLANSEQLVQECVAKTFEEVPEIISSQSDILLLSDHSNFYLETGNDQILNILPNNLIFTQDLITGSLSNFDPNEQEEIDVVGVSQSDSTNCGAIDIECDVDDTDDISDLMIFKNTTPIIEQIPQEVTSQNSNKSDVVNSELAPDLDCKSKELNATTQNELPKHSVNYTAEDLYNYVLNDKVHVSSVPLDDFKTTTNTNCMMNLEAPSNSHSVNQLPQCMVDNFNYLTDNLHTCGLYNSQLLDQGGVGVIYSHAPTESTFTMPIIAKESQALLNNKNIPKQLNQNQARAAVPVEKTIDIDLTETFFKAESKAGAKQAVSPKSKPRLAENNTGKVKRGRPRLGTRKRSTSKSFVEDCNVYVNDNKYNKRASSAAALKNAESCYATFNAHNTLSNAMNLNLFKTQAEAPTNNYKKDYLPDLTKTYAHERLMGNNMEKLPMSQKLFNHNESYNKTYAFNAAKTYSHSQERPLNNYNTSKGAGDNKFYPHSHKLGGYHLNSCADKLPPYFDNYPSISTSAAEKCYKDSIDISRTLNQHSNYASLNSVANTKNSGHEQNAGDIDNNLLSSVTEVSNTNKEYIKLLSTFMPRETLNYDAYKTSGENNNPFYNLPKYDRRGAVAGNTTKQFDGAPPRIDKGYVAEPSKSFFPTQPFNLQKSYASSPSGIVPPGRPLNMNFENMNLTAQKHAATNDLANLNMGMYSQPPNPPLTDTTGISRQYSKGMKNSKHKSQNLYETPKPPPINTHSSVKYLNELHAMHTRKAGEKIVPKVPRKRKCDDNNVENPPSNSNTIKDNTDSVEKKNYIEALSYANAKDNNVVATSELSPNSSSIEDDHEFNEEEINTFLRLLNNGSETSLPFKKRRRSVKQGLNNYRAQEEEISYPATPMISIAEIEALQSKSTVRPFKTPAERKEMPPLPVSTTADNSSVSPVISEQININNHTYINPIINCHMHATTTFLQLPVYHPVNNQVFLKVNPQNGGSKSSLEVPNSNMGAVTNE